MFGICAGTGAPSTALPHLPSRQHGGELMRSKVRGRRQPGGSASCRPAAGSSRAAPAPPARHLQPHHELIAGPLLGGRQQHLPPRPPNSHLWPCPHAGVWSRLQREGAEREGGMVLTLLAEDAMLAACLSLLSSLEGRWPVAAWFDRGRNLRDN